MIQTHRYILIACSTPRIYKDVGDYDCSTFLLDLREETYRSTSVRTMAKLAILCVNVLFIGLIVAEVPSYITVCGRRNPNLDECVKNSVELLRPKLISGIPELDVPPIDPLKLNGIMPMLNSQGLVATASNVTLFNTRSFQIRKVNVDLQNQKIMTSAYFDKMRLQGNYEILAKIIVPIEGKGTIDLDIQGIDADSTMSFQLRDTKKGKQVFFTSMSTKLKINDYQSRISLKEGPDPTFNDAINAVINTNRREITESITPSLEKVISTEIIKLANKICKNFSYEELFPDHE